MWIEGLVLIALSGALSDVSRESVDYASGDLRLAAELLLPNSEELLPAAVILQGSGDSDRSNSWAAGIAEELAASGVAVLLTDKRGCGLSEGDWRNAGFDDLALDALAGVEFLMTLPEVDPDRIGVVGLSQGGWVAPIAAARSSEVAFVIVVSGAAVGFAEQVSVEMANTARQAGLDEDEVAEILSLNRLAGRYAMTGRWGEYSEARERAMGTRTQRVAAGFPGSGDHPRWNFIRKVGAYDPMPFWVLVDQPALIVYGEEDEKDNVPVRESVRRLEHAFQVSNKGNARILVIPGGDHGLIDQTRGQLMEEFTEALRSFVEAVVRS